MAYVDNSYKTVKPRRLSRGPRRPWKAVLNYKGRRIYLGHYGTREAARRAERVERERYKLEEA